MVKFGIVIPAHNEALYISETLHSLCTQTLLPTELIVVDDHSTDETLLLAQKYQKQFSFIKIIKKTSSDQHLPGKKVIEAFYKGLAQLPSDCDIVCKFDADLIFPPDYLATIAQCFLQNPKIGMASGILYTLQKGKWQYENIADRDHIRGPIKAYRKTCLDQIGGLKPVLGWDTVDVLLAKFYGWKTQTLPNLIVKHLKPTGNQYEKSQKSLRGAAMYKMRYGIIITSIAALKIAWLSSSPSIILYYLKGYLLACIQKENFVVSKQQGNFIRNYRWKKIKNKLFNK